MALTHVGCMAHARRKFSDAVKAQGKNKKRGKAHRGLALIRKLYRIERQARKLKIAPDVMPGARNMPGPSWMRYVNG